MDKRPGLENLGSCNAHVGSNPTLTALFVYQIPFFAPVAQLDRASASGAEGRRFESFRAYCIPFGFYAVNTIRMNTFKTISEFSAGGVVYRLHEGSYSWLIGKHSGYHKWVLPKGLIEKGETGFEAAVREVEEEMGVQARIVLEKPIYTVKYVYWADYKNPSDYQQSDEIQGRRRVAKYQEHGGKKVKVFKVVSFFLMECIGGDSNKHDWEMEEAGWYLYEEAMKKLDFKGEKEALQYAQEKLQEFT